jgi:hypothetical protein
MAGQGRHANPVYQFYRLTGFCRLFRRYDNHLPEGDCFGRQVAQAFLPAEEIKEGPTGAFAKTHVMGPETGMKSILLGLFAAILFVGISGCAHRQSQGCRVGCNGACSECGMLGAGAYGMTAYGEACDPGRFRRRPGDARVQNPRAFVGPTGPPTAAVTYPYYTVRGPRDFLLNDPLTIGP